jgi:hypothetical protein
MPNNEIQQSWFFDLAEKTIEKGNDWQYREEQTLDDVFKIHPFDRNQIHEHLLIYRVNPYSIGKCLVANCKW